MKKQFVVAAALLIMSMEIFTRAQAQTIPVTAGRLLHIDASNVDGDGNPANEPADGANVTAWVDVAVANNLTAAAGQEAQYVPANTPANSRPSLRFIGSQSDTYTFASNISTIRMAFFVVKEDFTSERLNFLLGHPTVYNFHRGANGTIWRNNVDMANILNGVSRVNGTAVNGTTTQFPLTWTLISVATAGNLQAQRLSKDRAIGTGIASRSWEGNVAEMVLYNNVLTASDEAKVGNFLGYKYGLPSTYQDPAGPSVSLTNAPFGNIPVNVAQVLTATVTVVPPRTVAKVEFFVNGVSIGVDTTPDGGNYSVNWTPTAPGSYSVYAYAVDDLGNVNPSQILTATAPYFVNAIALGAGTGADWANATTIGAALSANNVAGGGGLIAMTSGTHLMTSQQPIMASVQIYGGYMGTEPEAAIIANPLAARSATFPADSPTTISGGKLTRIFNITNAGAVTFNGLGLADGYITGGAYGGGAIYALGTQLTLNQCSLYNNASNALTGGAIRADAGCVVTMTGCVASSNTAYSHSGGVLSCITSTATLTGSSFSSNSATGTAIGVGGAIFTDVTALTIDQCSFYGNAAFHTTANGGGAIYAGNTAPVQPINISRTDFTSNTVSYNGGAMNVYGNTTLTSCTFVGNSSSNGVGAIRLNNPYTMVATDCRFESNWAGTGSAGVLLVRADGSHTTFTRCLFLRNSTLGDGGALYMWHSTTTDGADGQMTLIDCLFDGNTAGRDSGAVHSYFNNQGVRAINCTFVNNRANGVADGVYVDTGAGAAKNLFLNCVFDGQRTALDSRGSGVQATVTNCLTGLNGANALLDCQKTSCVVGDPRFVNAAAGDYHLQNNSPAIGAGADAAGDLIAPADDLEGTLRGTPVDIGAYENSLDSPAPGPAQDVRYAMTAAQGLGDGSSWANAATLPGAVAAVSPLGVVFVSSGTYAAAAPLVITKPMSLYGGCIGIETTPSARQANFMNLSPTTVTAGGAGRAILAQNLAYLELDGINVADGYLTGGDGAGLYLSMANTLTIRNAVFANNIISSPLGIGGRGGAMATTATNAIILSDCVFTDNFSSATGGAIYVDIGVGMTADRCVFYNNKTLGAYNGGGIYTNAGALTLNACTFTSHSAWQQGAAVQATGPLTINGCTITRNSTRDDKYAAGGGGAVYGNSASTVNMINSTFTANAGRMGGAFRAYGGTHTVNVTSCVFEANQSAHGGGAIFIPNNAVTLNISNSVFFNNKAGFYAANTGGAINTDVGAIPTITNCLFYGNIATGATGGAINTNSTPGMKVVNCTFSNNVALTGAVDGIYWAGATNPANNVILNCVFSGHRVAVNCSANGARGYVYNSAFDDQLANGVLNAAVINCVNGPVVFANAAANDYHLQNMSLGIGAGAMAAGGQTAPALDLDGVARPLPAGTNPDAGVFENALRGVPDPNPTTYPTVYVTAAGGGNGSSWLSPTTLPNALAIVTTGGKIFMKGGAGETHLVPTSFTVNKGMSIYGGFAGVLGEDDPSKRQPDYLTNYVTTLDGQNQYRPLYFVYAGPVTLDALTFVKGFARSAYGGGGACVEYGAPFTIRDCVFNNNVSLSESGGMRIAWTPFTMSRCNFTSNTSSGGRGGGLAAGGASGLVEDCVFSGNTAGYSAASGGNQRGGGISAYMLNGGTLTIRRTTITANNTWDDGGSGLHCYDGSAGGMVIIEDSSISGNFQNGGANAKDNYAAGIMMLDTIKVYGANSSIDNNVAGFSNTANNLGGGIGMHGSSQLTFTNCSISGNRLTNDNTGDCYGAGLFIRDTTSATLINCQVLRNLCYNTGAGGAGDQAFGGGLCVIDTPNLTMIGCRIEDNATSTGTGGGTQSKGGGIFIRNNATVNLTSCTLLRNVCWADLAAQYGTGGGMGIEAAAKVTLTNCILANNISEYEGGGIRARDNVTAGLLLKLVNCDFYGNVVTNNNQGQGISIANNVSTAPAVVNCLFDGHPQEAIRVADTAMTTSPRIYNCLFGNNGTNGVITAAPLNACQTGVASLLADPANFNFDLVLGSPAIDNGLTQAGATTAFGVLGGAVTVPSLDIAGRNRLYPAPAIPDIGAYELLQSRVFLTPDPFHFGVVDAGSSVTSTITVVNTGNVAYTLDAGNWATSGAPFSVVTPFAGVLASGDTEPVVLRFAPVAAGDYTGQFGYSDAALTISSATLRGATPPQVISITRLDGNPTSASAVQYLVTFSQPVVNADPTDFDLATTGAFPVAPTVLSVIPAGATLTVTINTGTGAGQIQLVLNAGSDIAEATYLAPLSNKPFAGEIYNLDNMPATIVSIIPRDGLVTPTSASSVIYDVTFSKPVSGVTMANFSFVSLDGFASGTILSVSNGGGSLAAVWQATVGALTSSNATGGFLQLNLTDPSGIVDAFGNLMTATATGDAIWVDSVAPTFNPLANVDPTSGSVVGTADATTITFSEAVTGVTADKLTITTDGVTILTPTSVANPSGDQKTYGFTLDDVYGSGPVALNMTLYGTSGTTILDAAGNPFTLAQWSITKDVSVVQVTIASTQVANGGLTSLTQVTFHAHFQVAMAGFDPETQSGDLQLNNCAYVPGSFSGLGTDYDFAVQPLGEGAATVRIPAGVCQTSGLPTRGNGTSNLYGIIFDQTPAAFTILSVIPARAQVGTTVTLSLSASEALIADPLVAVNAHAAAFASKAGNNYTYAYVIVSGDPETTATIAMTGTDLAGNTSTTVNNTALYVDKTAPTATIQPVSPDGGAVVTVDFSEDVTGVDVTDFSLTKDGVPYAGITNFTIVNGRQVTFNVPNAQPGLYAVKLQAAGSNIRDLAGIPLAADATDTWAVAEGAAAVELWSRY